MAALNNNLLITTLTQNVETIWEGNIVEWSRAFDLICIVDQIHNYAINHHRPFVMKHLEAWHARHQKTLELMKQAVQENDIANSSMDADNEDLCGLDSGDINSDLWDFDQDFEMSGSDDTDKISEIFGLLPNKPAEWLRLKEQSQIARVNASNKTRERNRDLLKVAPAVQEAEKQRKARSRGRPPKAKVTRMAEPKRRRGRPRKASLQEQHQGP